ncbi:MAG: proline--tRNA ligase, partial [Lachnospiraceae bacterium]|nr:proline--tRNA ligase [Lachnospiraceae bacterium]
SAGVMFSDADLLGIPLRVIVSPRNLKEDVVEFSARDKSFSEKVKLSEAVLRIKELVERELSACEAAE